MGADGDGIEGPFSALVEMGQDAGVSEDGIRSV